ncbi:MAG TPA: ABC transporter substrate-binding protein, partial [Fimbriimonas sp.]|nr:ABC transporter substrate-binding protein [Fimbriimonas sp.]
MRPTLLALFFLMLVGCGNKGGFSERKTEGQTGYLTYCIGATPTTYDPARVQDIDTNDILKNIYEPLVDYDENGKLIGVVARSWEISADGKTYTFKTSFSPFHNGEPAGAEDVKHSFERALSSELASPTAETYLGDIVGSDEVIKGTAKELSGIKVIDPMTVEIKIKQPIPYFLGKLTYACAAIVPRTTGNAEISDVSRAIGTGPFKLATIKPEVEVLLSRFDEYPRGKAKIEGIRRRIVKDPATRLNLFRTGETHICGV